MCVKYLIFSPFLFTIVLMLLAVFSIPTLTAAEAQTGTIGDHLALLAIKSMIKDDPQGVMASWNHSTAIHFCKWQGVNCSTRHQRVTHLDLSGGGINGALSPSIGNLSFLRGINLSSNGFSDEIPPEIGRLYRLRELSLRYNSFTGNIPTTIMNCSDLEVLDLGFNNLSLKIPDGIGSLSRLLTLDVSGNILEGGQIPPSIANLTLLNQLSLSDCHLGGTIPDVFQRLTNLTTVGSILPLRYLDISGNNFMENLTEIFMKLPLKLYYLDISRNHFHGTLKLWRIPESLLLVDLSSNEFGGSLHEVLCSNGNNSMQILNLGNNNFSGVIPKCWEKWPSLKFLNLQNNNLSGEIPSTLGFMPSLEFLNMHGNKISGRLPSSLLNLSSLKSLQLGENKLVGNIPTWIGTTLTLLRILNLRSNHFYGNIPQELCYLSHVQILDLARNNLSGNIPRCFNNFSVLSGKVTNSGAQISCSYDAGSYFASDSLVTKGREETYRFILGLVMLLDLSSNNFSSKIPSELMALRELKFLNLSRNQLTGSIPDNIGDMRSLESFDLSANKLSGKLPMSLSRLNFLSNFNLSYNNLIGTIPTNGQIQSFNESSFFGNKLCGPPLTNGCVAVKVPYTIRDQEEDDGSNAVDWGLIVSITLGLVTGFWIIMAPLIVNTCILEDDIFSRHQ